MLQIQHICKEYRTGSLIQKALDDVSLNLRDNEFVAILGPSGSGKTTLLNIIGGLDRYDSGDLVINGISTKKYRERDWDSYRNHTIGFVFQSYNLIPHQTLLSNVELALTISGVRKEERRKRAVRALEEVGLGDQLHKKPNQLSGGQMQRVAVARALVNDPDILLADEPTGALDTATSLQIMELLKQVAKDRLVVMVTHNPELAEQYATRIVQLRDGRICADSDPCTVASSAAPALSGQNMGRSSMSLPTSVSLSFNNLLTKKARTILTAFAGSIGIIGIALILSLSTGVSTYIDEVEEDTLSGYPVSITSTGFDFTSLLIDNGLSSTDDEEEETEVNVIALLTTIFSKLDSNDLASLKEYLDSGESGIEPYVNAVEYTYDFSPQIYLQTDDGYRQVNPDSTFSALGFGGSSATSNSLMSSMMSTDVFYQLPETDSLYSGQYEVMAGHWPEDYNEIVLVLSSSGSISDFLLYSLGLRDAEELDDMIQKFLDEEEIEAPDEIGDYRYEDILGITFKLVNPSDYYEYDEQYEIWTDKSDNRDYMKQLVAEGEDLTIVGIVQPTEDSSGSLSSGLYYPYSLMYHMEETAQESRIVQDQLARPKINVLTGERFGTEEDEGLFDMDSLLDIDEEALSDLFSFDTGSLQDAFSDSFDLSDLFDFDLDLDSLGLDSLGLSSLNLSDLMDFDALSLELPGMEEMDLSGLLGDIQLDTSSVDMDALTGELIQGYSVYITENPEAAPDFSGLTSYFTSYLQSESASSILRSAALQMMTESDFVTVSTDSMGDLAVQIITGFLNYVLASGGSIADLSSDYTAVLGDYLNTEEAQSLLQTWMDENVQFSTDAVLSEEQMNSLSAQLTEDFASYAEQNDSPDLGGITDSFLAYLSTDSASSILTGAFSDILDTQSLEEELTANLSSLLSESLASYGDTLADSLEAQLSDVMSEVTDELMDQLMSGMTEQISLALETVTDAMVDEIGEALADALDIDADAFSEAFSFNLDTDDLTELILSVSTAATATYEGNLSTLGYIDFESPSEIELYPINFSAKDSVLEILDGYNDRMAQSGHEEKVLTYTDTVGTLMSSVTDIIDMISYVLIAFVAISLVVSSIMIGVITYISVLERQKEIGILRAIGASRGNISQVFNAETGIIGLSAGLLGIALAELLMIPGNALIHTLAGNTRVNMILFPRYAVLLIVLSVVLTLIGGLIPSRKAAHSDPVIALRTE